MRRSVNRPGGSNRATAGLAHSAKCTILSKVHHTTLSFNVVDNVEEDSHDVRYTNLECWTPTASYHCVGHSSIVEPGAKNNTANY